MYVSTCLFRAERLKVFSHSVVFKDSDSILVHDKFTEKSTLGFFVGRPGLEYEIQILWGDVRHG
jgi:hypothetical protein